MPFRLSRLLSACLSNRLTKIIASYDSAHNHHPTYSDHYVNYSAVLVRLSRVNPDVLRDLLGMAYKFVTAGVAPRSPSQKRRKFEPRR